jgi:hypothetical protein
LHVRQYLVGTKELAVCMCLRLVQLCMQYCMHTSLVFLPEVAMHCKARHAVMRLAGSKQHHAKPVL